ncbi:hypothetical protein PIB30_027526 [Stylosanthes scabra]|uniref:RING-type domain-containing protein n=1 Tax=Stylosanthes scabra TaxID=79078 RepID=A0ABU6SA76_9FABA|nr:hypothetical protein [Stylosanthes scabra]
MPPVRDPLPKPNPNILSFFLKPIIMLLITALFFLFLGFAAFILLHLFLIGGALHRLRNRPYSSSLHPSSSSSDALSPRHLTNLPHFRVSRASPSPGPDSRCVVCLDGFRNGQWCRNLAACGHVFHRRCVDTWLMKVAACPTCRTPVRLNAAVTRDDHAPQFWTCASADSTALPTS